MQIISLPPQAAITYNSYWDGQTPQLHKEGVLTISDSLISKQNIKDATISTWDFSKYCLLPSLIDGHVHLMMPQNGQTVNERLSQYLSAGVCVIRDAGNKQGFVQSSSPCLLLQAGFAIYKNGYYGSALGIGVSSLEEALTAVDNLAAGGASHIKVISSGIFSFNEYAKTGPATFTVAELTQIVARAESYNLPVMAHASGDEAVRRCLQAKVTTIEHGYFMSEETLCQFADSKTYWLPTLAPIAAQLAKPELAAQLTP